MVATTTLRVLTWNVWWQFGPWRERQPGIGAVLRDERPDVVCLQEVWAEEGGADQAEQLAAGLGFDHARSDSPFRNGVAFGNAILSRWPITAHETVRLPDGTGGGGPRTALFASVDAPHGELQVVSTHFEYPFDRSATRQVQARALAELVGRKRGDPERAFPTIVCGDLNAVPDSDEIRALTGRTPPLASGVVFQDAWELAGGGAPGWTWAGDNVHLADATWPNRRIDYVLVSWPHPKTMGTPIRVALAGTEAVGGLHPSDHYGVVADLRTG